MPLPRVVARLNKRYTNRLIEPFVERFAGFAVVEHTGRRSGTSYRTPVYAFGHLDTHGNQHFVVALTYGPVADWCRNVQSSGGTVEHDDRRYEIVTSTMIGRDQAWPHLPPVVRGALRILRVTDFLQMAVR